MAINKIIVSGYIGAHDAESRRTPQGTQVSAFDIAVTTGSGDSARTSWFKCRKWGDLPDWKFRQLKAKSAIVVMGRFIAETKEIKGVEKTYLNIDVDDFFVATRAASNSTDDKPDNFSAGFSADNNSMAATDDCVPF